jgi:hypothetical protein
VKLQNPHVPRRKLTDYLLVWHEEDDKSGYLALAGFTTENPSELEAAVLAHAAKDDAVETRRNEYGIFYSVDGGLAGPNGKSIRVRTVWILREDGRSHLVTLVPVRAKG